MDENTNKNPENELNEFQEEEDEFGRVREDYNKLAIEAATKGDIELLRLCIERRGNINFEDKKKWTPLLWASCKGHTDIVRLLIENSAEKHFQKEKIDEATLKVVMGSINVNAKANPLQWACFKGHPNIVILLLKAGLDYRETDSFGNNSIHLATSSGNSETFKILLMWGVRLDSKNSRGHVPADLATNPETVALIESHDSTKICSNSKCGFPFKDDDLKRLCHICKFFFCQNCHKIEWMYFNKDCQFKENLDGRCNGCWNIFANQTNELQSAIENRKLSLIKDLLEKISLTGAELDVKLIHKAHLQQEKLETQNKIMDFLNKNRHVDNYKTILKAVKTLCEFIEDAREKEIDLDEDLVREVYDEVDRLKAERNLRYQLDNTDISSTTEEDWNTLKELNRVAEERGVEKEYLDIAKDLSYIVERNLKTREIKALFKAYPFREYPEPIMYDPKTKKPIDPVTKKPIDPKKLAPPKKKKKKEPKFIIPDWANDNTFLEARIKELESLFSMKDEFEIPLAMIEESKEDIIRMKKEVRYRKQLDEEARMLAEKKLADKKKKR